MNYIFHGEIIKYDFFNANATENLLFLHGWGGDKNSFISTINLLKRKFNILAITLPTIEKTNLVWTMKDYRDLVLNILKLHNFSHTSIACHSFGFRVACLIKEFILIERIVVTGGAGPKRVTPYTRLKNNNTRILLKQNRFKYLYLKNASSDYLELNSTNKKTFKNVVNFNTKNLIRFNCPTLLFWGKRDQETPLWIAKKINKNNNSKLIITSADHFAYIKMNALFNNEIRNFLC